MLAWLPCSTSARLRALSGACAAPLSLRAPPLHLPLPLEKPWPPAPRWARGVASPRSPKRTTRAHKLKPQALRVLRYRYAGLDFAARAWVCAEREAWGERDAAPPLEMRPKQNYAGAVWNTE